MADVSTTKNRNGFVSPYTPRYREVFYSAIPITWPDITANCITCLPCARDTFTPTGTPPQTTLNNKTDPAPPTPPPAPPGCVLVTVAEVISCGDQNWFSGPQTGIPYSNTGDNVTGWVNITNGDWTSNGTELVCSSGGNLVCDWLPTMVSNGFTMTGTVNFGWDGETASQCRLFLLLVDQDNQRAVGFKWHSPTDDDPRIQTVAYCDISGGGLDSNTEIDEADESGLNQQITYDFTFSYVSGILNLSVTDGSETVELSMDLGCDVYGKVVIGADNENGSGDCLLTDIVVS